MFLGVCGLRLFDWQALLRQLWPEGAQLHPHCDGLMGCSAVFCYLPDTVHAQRMGDAGRCLMNLAPRLCKPAGLRDGASWICDHAPAGCCNQLMPHVCSTGAVCKLLQPIVYLTADRDTSSGNELANSILNATATSRCKQGTERSFS